MGKSLRHRQSSLPSESNPGCMWGPLHILDNHQWRRVKKMLPHKRQGSGGHNNVGYSRNAPNDRKIEEHVDTEKCDLLIEDKRKHSSQENKISVKARIKELISEEMSKKKSRHIWRSTCPAQSHLMRTISIHHLEPSDQDPLAKISSNGESAGEVDCTNYENCCTASSAADIVQLQVHEEPSTINKICVACGTLLPVNNENQPAEIDTLLLEKLDETKEALLEQKLIHAEELAGDASLYQSKEFMDALDLISMNKDLFAKILQDPESHLARHFHGQRPYNKKVELTKSGTFPAAGESVRRDIGGSKHKQDQQVRSHSEGKNQLQGCSREPKLGVAKSTKSVVGQFSLPHDARPETADGCPPVSPHFMNKKSKNQAAIKRFKDLKHKIKHLIKEDRKERHRVGMDAVLHKIPYGKRLSKDAKWKEPAKGTDSPSRMVGLPHIRRASSFKESLDRYCQLFESSFSREPKSPISEGLKPRAEEDTSSGGNACKSLGRIHSLPDLISPFYFRNEDSYDSFSSGTPIRNATDSTRIIGTVGDIEPKSPVVPQDAGKYIQLKLENENEEHEEFSCRGPVTGEEGVSTPDENDAANAEANQIVDGLDKTIAGTSPSLHEQGVSSTKLSTINLSDPFPVSLDGAPAASTPEVVESRDMPNEIETPEELLETKSFLHHVDTKDEADFNYVRDVLELSGFSRDELLGTWHSIDQPLDPSMFDEVEGCLFDPNHLLMFDLINEVLMETYESSFTYCPMLLSSLCHVRPMPVGHHVLEEVWSRISWYLSFVPEQDGSLDYVVDQDLSRDDGWMNLRFDTECAGLEIEDLIFDGLLDEVISG